MNIPHDILRDHRCAPDYLTRVIESAVSDMGILDAKVAAIEERMAFECAKAKLGMARNLLSLQAMEAELVKESAYLANARRALIGLRAIEAARDQISRAASDNATAALAGQK